MPGPVASVDDLSFFVKRFAPRVRLRVARDAVLAVTSEGELHVPAAISYVPEGRGEILGIGDDHVAAPNAVTVRLFTPAAVARPDYADLVDKFVRRLLRRVLLRAVSLRPVVIVEGLESLPPEIAPRAREGLLRGLASARTAAVVVGDAS